MARSDAHDRIVLRIERAVPAKHFHGNGIRLYPAAAPGEGLLNDILQEAVLAAGRVELGALPDAGELGETPGVRGLRFLRLRCCSVNHGTPRT
ncbi:hypothetical protein I7G60_31995 [Sinorhizobium meliloti]|nr:hypothetical protein [Sinorhizobium meliloti]